MMNLKILLPLCLLGGVLFADEVVPNTLPETVKSITAIGAMLAIVGWLLLKTIPCLLKQNTQQTELHQNTVAGIEASHKDAIEKFNVRWDGWEKMRHEDSQKLNDTLREMVQRCAEMRSKDS